MEYGTVAMLSEVLHLTGLQGLHHGDVVPISQLSSVLSELYSAIRTAPPCPEARATATSTGVYIQLATNGIQDVRFVKKFSY